MKLICFDLDDTLYKEIDYLKSAYREIVTLVLKEMNSKVGIDFLLSNMLEVYFSGDNAFKFLNTYLGISKEISEYLDVYRNHKPKISLSQSVVELLEIIKYQGHRIGLITDGRSIQQRNKIKALGLNSFIEDCDIVISEEFGSEKPSLANYKYFMNRYPQLKEFVYIGDNVKKDFLAPNELCWKTICLKDNGENIHKQMFDVEDCYLPNKVVENLSDILPEILSMG